MSTARNDLVPTRIVDLSGFTLRELADQETDVVTAISAPLIVEVSRSAAVSLAGSSGT